MANERILVVDDDPEVRDMITATLQDGGGYRVIVARDGREGLERVVTDVPDLLIIDWNMPHGTGIDVVREIRRRQVMIPVIMLTAHTSRMDVIVGLEVGADDYVTKPFEVEVLLARVKAHLRRMGRIPSLPNRVRVGAVELDIESRCLRASGQEMSLTRTEFRIVHVMMANAEKVLTRDRLLEQVWGIGTEVEDHSVDPHMQRVRRKLQGLNAGVRLEAIPGIGYRLTVSGRDVAAGGSDDGSG